MNMPYIPAAVRLTRGNERVRQSSNWWRQKTARAPFSATGSRDL